MKVVPDEFSLTLVVEEPNNRCSILDGAGRSVSAVGSVVLVCVAKRLGPEDGNEEDDLSYSIVLCGITRRRKRVS